MRVSKTPRRQNIRIQKIKDIVDNTPARGFLALLSWEGHTNLPINQVEISKANSAINNGNGS